MNHRKWVLNKKWNAQHERYRDAPRLLAHLTRPVGLINRHSNTSEDWCCSDVVHHTQSCAALNNEQVLEGLLKTQLFHITHNDDQKDR
jgi:hypothetical protein